VDQAGGGDCAADADRERRRLTEITAASDIMHEAIHAARLLRGPSRRLDGMAWAALHFADMPTGEVRVSEDGVVRVVRRSIRKVWRHGTNRTRYSESIEHAAAAVPLGFAWRVSSLNWAELIPMSDLQATGWTELSNIRRARGATPALALLIVTLETARTGRK
jgi:hypothetical protein